MGERVTGTAMRDMIDPVLRDSRHPGARAAREQADWLSYLELGGAAPSYLVTCQKTTDLILKDFPEVAFDEFTASHLAHVLKQYPAPSRKTRLANISSWFKWGIRTRRIPVNPLDQLPPIKGTAPPLIEVFTDAEMGALTGLRHPDGILMQLLFDTGLRAGEARHLRGRRIDFDRREVLVVDGAKGGKQRRVPVEPDLLIRLDEFFTLEGINNDDYLWATHPGGTPTPHRDKPMGESSIKKWWRKCVEETDVRYRKMHTTRHTYATRMRNRGLELEEIQLLLGHASIQTTSDMYVHTRVDDIARKLARLP